MNVSINGNKHMVIAKILLISTMLLTILQVILSIVALPWSTAYFVVRLLPALMTGFILLKYKTTIKGENYQKQLALPIILILVTYVIVLLEEINGLSFYSENPLLNSFTTWEYICLYAINCGPSVVALAVGIFTIIVCFQKKKKSILSSIMLCLAAIVQFVDGVALLMRGYEVYVEQFGLIYVLFLAVSTIVSTLVFITFSVLMLPAKTENTSLFC